MAGGVKDSNQKLLRDKAQEKRESFGREDSVVLIPVVVAAVPGVHVPLMAIPVHVHDEAHSYPGPSVPLTTDILRSVFYSRPQSLPVPGHQLSLFFMDTSRTRSHKS